MTSYKVIREGAGEDGADLDVTEYYTFGESVDGTLKVNKKALTLTSGSKEKPYDGTALTNADVEGKNDNGLTVETGWVEGEGATYEFTGSQTDVGDSPNAFSVTAKTGTKLDNYEISKTEGTLKVTDTNIDPKLIVTKNDREDDSHKYKEGDTVTFDITATNVYDGFMDITLSEIEGVTLSQETFTNVGAGRTIDATATYVVTAEDMAAGEFTNIVTATIGEKSYQASDTIHTADIDSALTVTKEASKTSGAKVDDVITYTVVVTNSGNATISGITLSDSLVTLSEEAFTLTPKEEKTIKYEYTVTQEDVDKGTINNTVTASGQDPSGKSVSNNASAKVTTEAANAKLSITKTADPTSGVAVDDEITYTVVVKNEGNVSVKAGSLEDDHADLSDKTFALAPGKEASFEYTYKVTQADIDAGKVVNVVKANATAERGENPEEVSATATVTTEAAEAKLSITKTADPTSGVKKEDTITYKVVVTNIGNVSVTNGTLTDDHADLTGKTFSLAPGKNAEFTYEYTVTQADVNAGTIKNTVKANAKAVRGDDPAEVSASATVTTEDAAAKLSITKTAEPTSGVAVGDTVTYTVVVKNDGNVAVTDVKLADDHVDLSEDGPTIGRMEPGVSTEFSYDYTVTQADVDAGEIVNKVTANATAVRGNNPAEVSATATVTTEAAAAKLSITKAADKQGVKAGDTVTYTVVVKNEGNVSVKDGKLEDDHADLSEETFALEPIVKDAEGNITNAAASTKKFIYTYKVTQADIDAGSIVNTVKANATAERGDDPAEVSASATVTAENAGAALSITKAAEPTSNVKVDDTITYTVVVKNTGNVGVKEGKLVDDHADLSAKTFALAPGASETFTYTYKVTQADVDAGEIVNTVKANAKAVRGADPAEVSATATVTTEDAAAKLSVTKTAKPTSGVKAGDTVTYTVVVKNEGNVSVKDGTLADDHADLTGKTFALAPTETAEFTYTYKVTQEDVNAGSIVNTVKANATAVIGKNPAEVSATATVNTEAANAKLSITKSANPTSGVVLGDTVTYTVVVKNEGNVSVKEGKLTDDHADLSDKTFTLDPGKTAEFTYTYKVTQADIDAGEIENTVEATAKAARGNDPAKVSAKATVTTETAKAKLSVSKTAEPTSGVAVGDTVTYTVVVTNAGNVSVNAGKLADDHADLSAKTFALAPGASETFTYTYEVTQADIDAGSIVNTVKANAKAVRGDDPAEVSASATVTAETAGAKLSVTKKAEPTSGVKVGDTVTYTVVVKNEGNVGVKEGKLADDHADLSAKTFELAPGASETFTYTYKVTQADVNAGTIVNTVKANAKAARGADPAEVSATATVTAEEAAAKLSVTKTAKPTSGVKVGDTVTYTVVVKNEGNVSVKAGTLSDDHADLTGKTFALAPNETAEFSYTYKATQADVDAGQIVNTVKANATAERGANPAEATATATVTAEAAAAKLSITKTANPTSNVKVGDTVTYTVVVKNEGNVSVKTGKLVDDHADLSAKTFELAPGASETFTYTYTVTQADVDAGTIVNTVKANAKAVRGDDPAEVSATATVKAETAKAKLSVTKTAEPTSGVAVGDTVTYTVVVTNAGNVSVNAGKLADDHADLSAKTFALAPGASETFTYTYEVTQADIDAGTIVNTVKANAKAVRGDDPAEVSAKATVTTADAAAKLSITKKAEPTSNVKAGDTVTYTVVVKNEGNVSVKAGKLADDHVDLSKETFELAPGASKTVTYTYTVTQADVDAGKIVNTVKANATAERGENPAEVSAKATVTTETAAAELSITKEAKPTSNVKVGDEIEYKVVVTNSGNVSVKAITLADDHGTPALDKTALAPGENATATYKYTVTQADVDAGSIVNTVKANATAERGDDPAEVSATATVTAVKADAKLAVTKTADKTSELKLNDKVTYTVVVTNSGNVTVKGIKLSDTLVALEEEAFDLAPGAAKTITYTYTVKQADVDAGKIDNTVTATGKDPKNEDVSGTAKATVTTEDAAAKLSITKGANPTEGVAVGAEITYTVIVKNEGNVSVKAGKLVDDHADLSKETFELEPGKQAVFTYKYKVTQEDIDAGEIVNVVKANATAARGKDPAEVQATATVSTEESAAQIGITKTAAPTSNVKVGDKITYKVVVTNTGNVSVKNGTLSDDHADLSKETFALAPGKTAEFTYEYTVTQADVDAGSITNIVKANAKAVRGTDPAEATATATVTAVEKNASLKTDKETTSKPENGKTYALGETITYKVTVENNGNVTISDVKVTDALTKDEWNAGTMAPGDKKEFTAEYTVTEADILAGKVANEAVASGTDPQDEPTDDPGTTEDPTDPKNGHLTVDKETTSTPKNGETYALGEKISYKITVKNDGNLTITDIEVKDDLTGDTWKLASLEPGESKAYTTDYTVTEADVLAGKVLNVATATGKSPDPDEPDVPVTPGEDPEPTDPKNGHLTVEKVTTSTPENGKTYALGETITYKITVKNDGNLTIKDIEVKDELTGDSWKLASLEPGASKDYKAEYTVTEADILKGEVLNVATATGKSPDPDEPDVPVDPGKDPEPTDPKAGHLTVDKETTSKPKDGKAYVLGETVSYKITVTNDGNLTITNIEVKDDLTGDTWTIESLAPGKTETFKATHDVTEADILAGKVHNVATAKGTSPDPDKPDVPVTPGEKDDPTEEPDGHLTVEKVTTSKPANGKTYALNEEITYKVTVKNDGNLTITNVEVTDDLTGDKWTVASLAPGASEEFETSYKVVEKDILAGEVLNVATAKGDSPDPDEPEVPVEPGKDPEPTDDPAPSIDVEKSSNKVDGKDVPAGSDLTYTVKVTNTGNVTLNKITLTDDHGNPTDYATTLAPGESMTVDYNYTVTEADDNAGKVTNTVKGEGTDPNGKKVDDTDSITTIVGHNDVDPTPDPKDEGEEMDADGKGITVMYDGQKHTVSADASKPGSTIYYSTDGGETWSEEAPSRVDVGVTTFDIKATNPDYEDVVKTGYKLTVTKRPITLTSASAEKPYDGTPLVRNDPDTDITIGGEGLAKTDTLTFDITGSQTYVGSSENEFTYEFSKKTTPGTFFKGLFNATGPKAPLADDTSIADNYDVTVAYGTLTVTDDTDDENVITKIHEDKKYKVGETITFTIKVTNIYDEPKTITIEEQAGVTITGASIFEDVAPGETVTTTAKHKVTKADVEAGKFHNTATASFDGEDKTFNGDDEVTRLVSTPSEGGEPNTGDNGFGFDMTMMFGSAAAFLAMLFGRRRREQE